MVAYEGTIENIFLNCTNLTIHTYKSSYAAIYAKEFDIHVEYLPYGDLDRDGEITDWDGVTMARYLAGWGVDILFKDALDLDGDGEITDWDGVLLDRFLAGWDIKLN